MDCWHLRPADRADVRIEMLPDGEHVVAGLHVTGPAPGTLYWTKIAIPDLSTALIDVENQRRALSGGERDPRTVTFTPLVGGETRILKGPRPPQDGGQAIVS